MNEYIPSKVGILIVGAGPTGLGAATRLHQRDEHDWILVDSGERAGGLSDTQITPEGFHFDMGGHVIFSHFDYFDDLLNIAVGTCEKHWNTLQRVSYIWFKNRYVPYPFQNNLYCLDLDDQLRCINGLIDSTSLQRNITPTTFEEWIDHSLGTGIGDVFMRPYNFKVWAYPTNLLNCTWLGERVSTVDMKRVIRNVLLKQPDEGWGPNAVFRFPRNGGTGGIWSRVASRLPEKRLFFNMTVSNIDFDNKFAYFSDGSRVRYESLICTAPLDDTLRWLGRGDLARRLRYSSTHVIGIGLRGFNPHDKKCWMYYPESSTPFYRATVFSAYAEENCPEAEACLPTIRFAAGQPTPAPEDTRPRPGPYWSIMFEVSESVEFKPVDSDCIVEETIKGALRANLIEPNDEIVSIFHKRLLKGYPTPHIERDSVLEEALPLLKKKGVWSRGRFGAWKYEVGNQDHSVMQGVEAVDNILDGTPETTLEFPNLVNGRRNSDLRMSA